MSFVHRIRSVFCWIAVAFVLASVSASAATAEVLIVDCENGPFFEIAPAVEATVDGDTVLVRPCALHPYSPFAVVGKTDVHVVAALAADRPEIEGAGAITCIDVIGGSERVSIEGFFVHGCVLEAIAIGDAIDSSVVGNHVEEAIECIRDGGTGSRVVGNFAQRCATAFLISGQSGFAARNRATAGVSAAFAVVGDDNKVVENLAFANQGEGFAVQRANNRIERNRSIGNLTEGGIAEILIRSGSVETVVVGNIAGDSIADFGEDSQIVGNQ